MEKYVLFLKNIDSHMPLVSIYVPIFLLIDFPDVQLKALKQVLHQF